MSRQRSGYTPGLHEHDWRDLRGTIPEVAEGD
jgi:hypothetical protein